MRTSSRLILPLLVAIGLIPGCGPTPGDSIVVPTASTREAVVPHDGSPPSPRPPRIEDFSVPDPSPSDPVKAALAVRSAGGEAELVVAIRIARAHYVHAAGDDDSRFAPLSMELTLPEGVAAFGDWEFPPARTGKGGSPEYRDEVLLKRPLRIGAGTPRSAIVRGVLRYQACTEELCWPVGKMELSAPLEIGPKPGVIP